MARRKLDETLVEAQEVAESITEPEVAADLTSANVVSPPPVVSSNVSVEVRARVHFTDALTGKSFRPNDLISGWDKKRIAEYAGRGLVFETQSVAPSEFK